MVPPTHVLTPRHTQAIEKLKEWSIDISGKNEAEKRELLIRCAATSLNSKLISHRETSNPMRTNAPHHAPHSLHTRKLPRVRDASLRAVSMRSWGVRE